MEKAAVKKFIKILDILYQEYQKKHLNKKVGLFVSGGIDSSIIAYFTNKYFKDLTLLTLHSKKATDLEFVKILNRKLKRKLIIVELDEKNISKVKEKVFEILKIAGLKIDNTQISLACAFYLLCQKAKEEKINIVFTGQGPDILLAGYHKYQNISNKSLNEVIKKDLKLIEIDKKRDVAIASHYDIQLINPYLEKGFINFSLKIPSNLKINKIDGERFEKYLSRKVGKKLQLPEEIILRHKKALQYSTRIRKFI